jgi:hypothetical protein
MDQPELEAAGTQVISVQIDVEHLADTKLR